MPNATGYFPGPVVPSAYGAPFNECKTFTKLLHDLFIGEDEVVGRVGVGEAGQRLPELLDRGGRPVVVIHLRSGQYLWVTYPLTN